MRIVAVLAVIAVVAVSALPLAFAQAGSYNDKPDTIFQRTADKIGEPITVEVKPRKTIEEFQNMSDGIKIGAEEAKHKSLRTNPRPIAEKAAWL